MTTSAYAVAKFIVQNSERTSNLKLQKLLYYVQGWHIGLTGVAVFNEPIQAWVHGPVVPEIFRFYKRFTWTPIEVDSTPVEIPAPISKHVLAVLRAYREWTAAQLETQSHLETPWLQARGDLPLNAPSTNVITHGSMHSYFRSRANG